MARITRGTFQNKIAIVTGGASGIGEALSTELARRGAVVIVADIDDERAARLASEINNGKGRAVAATIDVSNSLEIEKLVEDVVKEHGRLDFMFNNAGISIVGEVRDMSLEHWKKIVDVNLMGVIYGTSAAYRVMIKQGDGHIVNTSSGLGLMPAPLTVAYSSTKTAIVALSHALREEAVGLGVRVSVACPGFVSTDIHRSAIYLRFNTGENEARDRSWMMTPVDAANRILQGTVRNRRTILFPFSSRLHFLADRLLPGIYGRYNRRMVAGFRMIREAVSGEEEETDPCGEAGGTQDS